MSLRRRIALALALLPLLAGPAAAAEEPLAVRLELPIACTPGADCWIVNYVDADPGPGARDYACGFLTYDGHKGTDFAVRDVAAMRRGVAVLAAAPGVVVAVRDGMDDVSIRDGSPAAVAERECGNGVRIRHDSGIETQYCHLRKGSVKVKRRDLVTAGQPIGLVGLSGLTEFPHVHLQLSRDGAIVDPFAGLEGRGAEDCGLGRRPLWSARALTALPYRPTALYAAGFAPAEPAAGQARLGAYGAETLSRTADVLAFWVDAFGVPAGDLVRLTVAGPDGRRLATQTMTVEKNKARWFAFVGRRRGEEPWPAGTYAGRAVLTRQPAGAAAEEYAIERRVAVK